MNIRIRALIKFGLILCNKIAYYLISELFTSTDYLALLKTPLQGKGYFFPQMQVYENKLSNLKI
jgi:hypothetical protein